jgi:hypothetical protein
VLHPIDPLFSDEKLVKKIKRKLPNLFQIAEIDCTRNNKIGQEVGATREKILTALLIHKFHNAVDMEIPPTVHGVDVILNKIPISIKTITQETGYSGVKLFWTADRDKASEFIDSYVPDADLMLAVIRWGREGGLYYILVEDQLELLAHIGRKTYLHQHRQNTNNRGVEYNPVTLKILADSAYASLPIIWNKVDLEYRPYHKWVEQWKLD